MIGVRKPLCNGAVGGDHDNHRMGDVETIAAGRIAFVYQPKCANDLGLGIGENRVLYFSDFAEAR